LVDGYFCRHRLFVVLGRKEAELACFLIHYYRFCQHSTLFLS
jgi:hypothetical protein